MSTVVVEEFSFQDIAYRLVRSPRRKRLGLVLAESGVEVRIPERCAARHGHQFLQENILWVREQLHKAAHRKAQIPQYHFSFDASFPWLNRSLPLIKAARSADSAISNGEIKLYCRASAPDPTQIQSALQRLYQREALTLLTEKSHRVASQLGLQFTSVAVRRTKSKWGHCTVRGALQYNWLVCLAPEAVVNYLVAHEVCHLRHHNHSAQFWQLVASVCPNYRELRRWLRDNGHRLQL